MGCLHSYNRKTFFLHGDGSWEVGYGNDPTELLYVDLDTAYALSPNLLGHSYWLMVVVALAFNRGMSLDGVTHLSNLGSSESFQHYDDDEIPLEEAGWWRAAWIAADTAEEDLTMTPEQREENRKAGEASLQFFHKFLRDRQKGKDLVQGSP